MSASGFWGPWLSLCGCRRPGLFCLLVHQLIDQLIDSFIYGTPDLCPVLPWWAPVCGTQGSPRPPAGVEGSVACTTPEAGPGAGWWWASRWASQSGWLGVAWGGLRCPAAAGTVLSLTLWSADQLWFKDRTARLQVVSHDLEGLLGSPWHDPYSSHCPRCVLEQCKCWLGTPTGLHPGGPRLARRTPPGPQAVTAPLVLSLGPGG